jgi:hypothetical protein
MKSPEPLSGSLFKQPFQFISPIPISVLTFIKHLHAERIVAEIPELRIEPRENFRPNFQGLLGLNLPSCFSTVSVNRPYQTRSPAGS